MMKQRDFHKLAILRGEARGYTTTVPSKKAYNRKFKHEQLVPKEIFALYRYIIVG